MRYQSICFTAPNRPNYRIGNRDAPESRRSSWLNADTLISPGTELAGIYGEAAFSPTRLRGRFRVESVGQAIGDIREANLLLHGQAPVLPAGSGRRYNPRARWTVQLANSSHFASRWALP